MSRSLLLAIALFAFLPACSLVLGTDFDARERPPAEPAIDAAATEPLPTSPDDDASVPAPARSEPPPSGPLPACEWQTEKSGVATATSSGGVLTMRLTTEGAGFALKVPVPGDGVASVMLESLTPGRSDSEKAAVTLTLLCPSKTVFSIVAFRTATSSSVLASNGNVSGAVVYDPKLPVLLALTRTGDVVKATASQGSAGILTEKTFTACTGPAKIGILTSGIAGTTAVLRGFHYEPVCEDLFTTERTF